MLRHRTLRSGFALTLAAAVCCGCTAEMPVAPVSGTITFEGEPLVGASITTQPMATDGDSSPGSGSFGRTDADGKYQLELVEPAMPGAIIGTHRVTIVRGDEQDEDPWSDDPNVRIDRSWPKRFTDGSLRLEVPAEGTTGANFSLSLRPKS